MCNSSIIDRFMSLCRIPSTSGNEMKTAEYCAEALTELGFSVFQDNAGEITGGTQGNIIASLTGQLENIPAVMLNAHMDTVEPGGRIVPEIKGNRIVSNGQTILGADNRAGIVMILEGVRRLINSGKKHGQIEVVLTVGEESGLIGALNLDYSKVTAKYGFSLDSSGLGKIAQGAPFYDAIDVKVIGRSAHAAVDAEHGLNSIAIMADALNQLSFGKLDEETTCNIGAILGGTSRNVVPAECQAILEIRSHSEAKLNQLSKKISSAFQKAAASGSVKIEGKKVDAKAEVCITREFDGFYLCDDSPVIKCAKRAITSIDRTPLCYKNMGGSDANIFNSRDLEVAIVGTGQTAVHSVDEYIETKDLIDGVTMVTEIIAAWTEWWTQKIT